MQDSTARPSRETPSGIPEPTLRRLPLYYQYIANLGLGPEATISCTQIASALNLIPIQVRKDLSCTGITGRPKTGYSVGELEKYIGDFLGWNNESDALIFGAGHLGMALMAYEGFRQYGLNIIAGVDSDPEKTTQSVKGKKIIPLFKAEALIKRLHIKIGILAVPAEHAQAIADLMTSAGIEAIWNFAPVRINVPEDVIVQHENLASSFAVLFKKFRMKQQS